MLIKFDFLAGNSIFEDAFDKCDGIIVIHDQHVIVLQTPPVRMCADLLHVVILLLLEDFASLDLDLQFLLFRSLYLLHRMELLLFRIVYIPHTFVEARQDHIFLANIHRAFCASLRRVQELSEVPTEDLIGFFYFQGFRVYIEAHVLVAHNPYKIVSNFG